MHDFDDGLTPKPGQKVVIIANAANCNRQVLFSVQDKGENILQAQANCFSFFLFFCFFCFYDNIIRRAILLS